MKTQEIFNELPEQGTKLKPDKLDFKWGLMILGILIIFPLIIIKDEFF